MPGIHEVKGKDGVGAKMDSMQLEKEKGITITALNENMFFRSAVSDLFQKKREALQIRGYSHRMEI